MAQIATWREMGIRRQFRRRDFAEIKAWQEKRDALEAIAAGERERRRARDMRPRLVKAVGRG